MIGIFDIIKFILSFLVISMHVEPFADINSSFDFIINNSICKIAVPIFFSIAGFLFFNKINSNNVKPKEYFIKYLKRLIIMYLFWSVLYFIPYLYQSPTLGRIIKFIPHLLIHGVYSQLWYLLSLIEAVVLFYFLYRKFGIKLTLYISIFLYGIGLLFFPYYSIISKMVGSIPAIEKIVTFIVNNFGIKVLGRNGFLFGLFFFTLGAYLTKFKKMSSVKNYLGILLSFALLVMETLLIKYLDGQYYGLQISLMPLTYFIMIFMLQFNNDKLKNVDTKIYRSLSILIYLVHEWIHFLYSIIIPKSSILCNSLISYLIICILSILLSLIIYHLSNTKKFQILKKVY